MINRSRLPGRGALEYILMFPQAVPRLVFAFGKWVDLHMLVMLGARQRTVGEYSALFNAAGFELARTTPTSAGASVVEAVPI